MPQQVVYLFEIIHRNKREKISLAVLICNKGNTVACLEHITVNSNGNTEESIKLYAKIRINQIKLNTHIRQPGKG